MADAFNLTAQLNLRGPNNIKTVVADIRRQLGTVNANLNFRIDPTASNNLARLNGALRAFNSTLGQTQTSANNAAQAISNLGRAVNSVNVRNLPQQVNASASAISKMSSSAATTTKTVQQTATAVEELGKQSYLAVKRFAAFSIPTAAVFALTNAVNKGVAAFIEYDKQFVKLQQITGESAGGLENLSKTITGLATGLGVASSDITNVASTLAQAGLSARDTERALKALALSNLAPSFDSMNETVEGSIALMRQFGINAGDLEKALGSVNAVAAKFAVEASDIITAIQRTGGVFATASKGVSEGTDALNEFIAVFTSVRATTRESAETIATGLRTIFTRIQRGSTIDALKEFGVNLQDAEGKFVGAYKAVELLSKGLSKIDPRDLRFSQIVEELGGFRQIGKVIPLIQQFATAQDALKVAQKGQGSLAADAAKAQESLANKITKVKEEFFALFREIGSSQGFQTIIRGALDLSSALIKVADSIKGILPALTIFAAFKGVSALTQFGTGFIGAARTRQKADGGPVYRFQSGGVVPGSGKGDKVRALLEPGEVVINNAAANSYGRENLLRMNRYASGGRIKSLLQAKPDLNRYYDTDDQKDKYTNISIKRPSQNTSFKKTREQYRDQAQSIWQGASNIFVKTNDLSAANTYIKNKTRINPGAYDADELNPKNQSPRRLNRIQGALTEKTVRGQTGGLRKLPNAAGADFVYSDSSNNFIEVKNKLDRTSDDDLYAKALLGYAYMSGKGPTYFKNNKLDNISGLSIELRSTNLLDIQKRNLGGIIQKFMSGDIVKSILSNVPTEPSPASLIQGPFPAKSAEYKKWKQQLSEIAAGFGIPYDGTNIRINGVSIPLGDALSSRKLTAKNFQQKVGIGNIPKLESLRKRILETYSRGQSDVAVADPFSLTDDEKSKAMRVAIVGLQSQYTEQYRQFFKKVGGRPLSVHVGALASDKAILDRMRQRDIASLDQGASELLPGAIPKKLTDKELDDLGRPNAEGYQLEVLLAKLGAVGGKSTNRGRAVDFEGGLPPNLAKLFGVPSGIFTQAKRTLSSDSVGDALEGIAARLAGVRMAFGGQVNGPSFEDIKKQILDKYPEIEFRISKRKTGRGFGYNLLGALRTDGGLLKSKGLKFQQPSNLQKLLEASDGMARDLLDGGSTRKFSSGGTVPAMVSNGEAFVPPEIAKRIGYSKLHQMNRADSNNMKGFSSGGISIFKGPGSGTSDSIGPIGLPEGSFILREKATKALGLSKGGSVHNFAKGGKTDQIYTNNINRSADISISKGNPLQGINLFFGSIEKLTNKLPASSGLIKNLDQTLGNLGQTFSNIRTQSRVTIQQLRNAIETDLRKAQAANLSTVSIDKLKKALQTLNDVSTTASSKLQDIRSARQYDRFTVAGTYVKNAFGNTLGSIPGSGAVSGFGKGLGGIVSRIGAGVGGQAGFMTSMALGMLAGQGENIFGKENGKRNNTGFSSRIGANNALTAAGLEAGSTTLSAGIATASSLAMIPVVGPFAAGLTVAVTAVKAWTNAVEAGKQAAENFATAQRQKNIDDASDKLGKSLEQFQKNPSDVTSQSNVIRNAASVSRQIADKSEADIRIARRQKIGSRTWSQWWNNETPQLGVDEMRSISDANAKAAQPAADAARGVIEARIESGSTLSDMANMPDFKSLAETIASANPEFAAARDRIRAMSEETVRATGKTKDQMVAEALHTEIVKLSNDPYLKSKEASMLAAKAMDDVNKAGRQLAMSFERLTRDYNQALNKTIFELEAFDRSVSGTIEAFSGNAKIGNVSDRNINILQNPNAYSAAERDRAQSAAASYFGKDSEAVKGMLKLDATDFAAKITQSLDENVLKNNASADLDSAASEARKVLNAQLKDAPENVRTQLLGELEAIQKTIDANPNFKSPKDKVNAFNEEVGKKLGQESLEAAKNIKEMAIRVLEFKNGALNEYTKSINAAAEATRRAEKSRLRAEKTITEGRDNLRSTLGYGNPSTAEMQARQNQRIAQLTGGITDPATIRTNIQRDIALRENKQKNLENENDPIKQKALASEIDGLNNKIIKGQEALEDLANSGEVASSALESIKNMQQAMEGQGSFLDRLASATPEEAEKLGSSLQRLSNNINGRFNDPRNNLDAQRAFNETYRSGGSINDAMRAGYAVLAQQRGEVLSAFKDIVPIITAQMKNQGATDAQIQDRINNMQANVRTGVYGEAGLLNNPLVAMLTRQQIDYTRNPLASASIARDAATYDQSIQNQAIAQFEQGALQSSEAALIMSKATERFDNAVNNFLNNSEVARGSNDPANQNPPRQGRARGGPIYAAGGGEIVPVMVSNGEGLIPPETAQRIGLNTLHQLNRADTHGIKSFSGGGMAVFKGPGNGTSDSIGPIGLPAGSYVIRAAAMKTLAGYNKGGIVGLAEGGRVRSPRTRRDIEAQLEAERIEKEKIESNVTARTAAYNSEDSGYSGERADDEARGRQLVDAEITAGTRDFVASTLDSVSGHWSTDEDRNTYVTNYATHRAKKRLEDNLDMTTGRSSGTWDQLDDKQKQELIDREKAEVNRIINDYAYNPGAYKDTWKETNTAMDARIAHGSIMRNKREEYWTPEEKERWNQIRDNKDPRMAAVANSGDASYTNDRSLLNDLDLVQSLPNQANTGRLANNAVNQALRDAGIPEEALNMHSSMRYIDKNGIDWTAKIEEEKKKEDFEARSQAQMVRMQENERKLAEDRLRAANVTWQTEPQKPTPSTAPQAPTQASAPVAAPTQQPSSGASPKTPPLPAQPVMPVAPAIPNRPLTLSEAKALRRSAYEARQAQQKQRNEAFKADRIARVARVSGTKPDNSSETADAQKWYDNQNFDPDNLPKINGITATPIQAYRKYKREEEDKKRKDDAFWASVKRQELKGPITGPTTSSQTGKDLITGRSWTNSRDRLGAGTIGANNDLWASLDDPANKEAASLRRQEREQKAQLKRGRELAARGMTHDTDGINLSAYDEKALFAHEQDQRLEESKIRWDKLVAQQKARQIEAEQKTRASQAPVKETDTKTQGVEPRSEPTRPDPNSTVEKAKRQIAEREARDNAARSQINPLTGKPYLDAAEKAGVDARLALENNQRTGKSPAKSISEQQIESERESRNISIYQQKVEEDGEPRWRYMDKKPVYSTNEGVDPGWTFPKSWTDGQKQDFLAQRLANQNKPVEKRSQEELWRAAQQWSATRPKTAEDFRFEAAVAKDKPTQTKSDEKDTSWIGSSNFLYKTLGYVGGLGEGAGRAVRGSAGIIAGGISAGAGLVIQGAGSLYTSEEEQKTADIDAKVKANQQKMMRSGRITQEEINLANTRETSSVGSTSFGSSLTSLGLRTVGAGASDVLGLANAFTAGHLQNQTNHYFGEGAGETVFGNYMGSSNMSNEASRNAESLRQAGWNTAANITDFSNTVGYLSSEGATALIGGGFSVGTTRIGKAIKVLGTVGDNFIAGGARLASKIPGVSQVGRATGSMIGKGISAVSNTQLGKTIGKGIDEARGLIDIAGMSLTKTGREALRNSENAVGSTSFRGWSDRATQANQISRPVQVSKRASEAADAARMSSLPTADNLLARTPTATSRRELANQIRELRNQGGVGGREAARRLGRDGWDGTYRLGDDVIGRFSTTLDDIENLRRRELFNQGFSERSANPVYNPAQRRPILARANNNARSGREIAGLPEVPRTQSQVIDDIVKQEQDIYGPAYRAARRSEAPFSPYGTMADQLKERATTIANRRAAAVRYADSNTVSPPPAQPVTRSSVSDMSLGPVLSPDDLVRYGITTPTSKAPAPITPRTTTPAASAARVLSAAETRSLNIVGTGDTPIYVQNGRLYSGEPGKGGIRLRQTDEGAWSAHGHIATPYTANAAQSTTSSSIPKVTPLSIAPKYIVPPKAGPNIHAIEKAGNVHFAKTKQNKYGLTGWKTRLSPKSDDSALSIKQWLDTRGKELGIAQYKLQDGTFTIYQTTGSRKSAAQFAKASEKELADHIQLGLYGEGDTLMPGTRISGRFDARDLTEARPMIEAQTAEGGKFARRYRKDIDIKRNFGIVTDPKTGKQVRVHHDPLVHEGVSSAANGGVRGVHDTGYVEWLKRKRYDIMYRARLSGQPVDASEIALLQQEIDRAVDIGSEWMTKNLPDLYANGGLVSSRQKETINDILGSKNPSFAYAHTMKLGLSSSEAAKQAMIKNGKPVDTKLNKQQLLRLVENSEYAKKQKRNIYRNRKNGGGLIYADNEALLDIQQRGADDQPTMLSRGEFVVKRPMAQKHMSTLQAINNGHYNRGGLIQYLNNGGVVGPKYYQNGGMINNPSISGSSGNGVNNTVSSSPPEWLSTLDEKVNKLSSSLQESLGTMFSNLDNVANKLNTVSQELPREMSITSNVNKNVNLNGISGEWNKYQGDILKMAGEQAGEQAQSTVSDKQLALSKWSEGQIPVV